MSIRLIVGLGNPGSQYVNTRHNIGFKYIQTLIKFAQNDVVKKTTCQSHLYRIMIQDQPVICIKPQTFMNASGDSVRDVMHFYKITPQELCVVTDDLDIEFGTVRVRKQGGAGTHNGMKSIIQAIGTESFMRLRLGIGPKPERMDAKDFVLQSFSTNEQAVLPTILTTACKAFLLHINDPIDVIMNRMNGRAYLDDCQNADTSTML